MLLRELSSGFTILSLLFSLQVLAVYALEPFRQQETVLQRPLVHRTNSTLVLFQRIFLASLSVLLYWLHFLSTLAEIQSISALGFSCLFFKSQLLWRPTWRQCWSVDSYRASEVVRL